MCAPGTVLARGQPSHFVTAHMRIACDGVASSFLALYFENSAVHASSLLSPFLSRVFLFCYARFSCLVVSIPAGLFEAHFPLEVQSSGLRVEASQPACCPIRHTCFLPFPFVSCSVVALNSCCCMLSSEQRVHFVEEAACTFGPFRVSVAAR